MGRSSESRPVALILAAGSGTRFCASGGMGLKQLALWKEEPVINRLVRQVRESGLFSRTVVVLGGNEVHQDAIKDSLKLETVDYVVNPNSAEDNNLLSFMMGVEGIVGSVLVIEADVVVSTVDLISMTVDIGSNEVRWSELGDVSGFTHGGLIELDPETGTGISVDVLCPDEFEAFKKSSRKGVKMFGLTAFGAGSLSQYKCFFENMKDVSKKYFHQVIVNEPEAFNLTICRVTSDSFSFNTVSEFPS